MDHFSVCEGAGGGRKTMAKQTIPPCSDAGTILDTFCQKTHEAFYSSAKPLMDDIAQAYVAVLHQLYDAGCRNVQFDDCTWECWRIKWTGNARRNERRAFGRPECL